MNAAAQQAPGGAITVAEQIASVIREIGMRKHVYPGWVAKGKMKQDKADHELAAMESALVSLRDYQAMQPKVLALSAVCMALGERLQMSHEALQELLTAAEQQALAELANAKLAIAHSDAQPWPFRREPMP